MSEVSGADLVQVVVEGLRKSPHSNDHRDESYDDETHTEQISLPKRRPVSALWDNLKGLRKRPDSQDHRDESYDDETHTVQISLPKNAPLSALWENLKGQFTLVISLYIISLCKERD